MCFYRFYAHLLNHNRTSTTSVSVEPGHRFYIFLIQTIKISYETAIKKQKFGTKVTSQRGIFELTRPIPMTIFGTQNAQL